MFARFLICGGLLLLPAVPAAAQAKLVPKAGKAAKQARTPKGIPAPVIDRLMKMSPEERDRALSNLPPERRQQIEQRLNQLDRLTPEQRDILDQRYQALQALPPARRQAIRQELQYLRSLRPVDRRVRILSDEFQQNYSPDEQKLIRDVITGR